MIKSEPKAFASLSSGLLARKGTARPAMRPQGFGQGGSGLEDLGWNDMGFEPPRAVLVPVVSDEQPSLRVNPVTGLTPSSPVHMVQEQIVKRLGQEEPEGEAYDDTAEPVALDAPPLEQVLAQAEPEAPAAAVAPEPVADVAPEPIVFAVKPAARPVVASQAVPVSQPVPVSRRPANGKAKAAFTLRLDTERHLKLRLACAVSGASAQALVTRALDALLNDMPELDAMADRAPPHAARRG